MNRDEFMVCRDYASMDLAFSLFNLNELVERKDDEKASFSAAEKGYYEWFLTSLRAILASEPDGENPAGIRPETAADLRELRRENKKRAEYFTVLTDRMVVCEYILNRIELKYDPEEKLDDFLKSNPEDAFLKRIMLYLSADRDRKMFGYKLQNLIGEIPIQITTSKLFELIDHAMTLYLGSDETALDELIYMLRIAGMVYNPSEYPGEYPDFEKPLRDFEAADLSDPERKEYDRLRDECFFLAGKLEYILDYYNELQRCTNDALALCLVRRWLPESDTLFDPAVRAVIEGCLEGSPEDELLVPIEGRIEDISMRLTKQMGRVEAPDMNGEEEEEYIDVATLARLLSNSLFAEIDPLFVENKTVTKEMIKEKEKQLFDELQSAMKQAKRPVKKAVIAKILEKLPPFITEQSEVEDYIRLNLFNCRDKAEKCASMAIILEMMEEG